MKRGFTLIELIVVVIIIGILATIAVPQYMKAVERARAGKAISALTMIAKAEKLRAAENQGVYIAVANSAALDAAIGSYIEMTDIAADADWEYSVTLIVGPPPGFNAIATKKVGLPNASETITLTNAGVTGGTFTP